MMASGWFVQTEGDLTVTAQLRFFLNGAEVLLPPGHALHIATEGRHLRATVECEGRFMPLADALRAPLSPVRG